ncbi:hypothetical protein DFH09DRAFT_1409260 [Mycena vulgaris]|nr:hypothetical protein DFH09DRAFT_1409260 [Mycena vulgaris]
MARGNRRHIIVEQKRLITTMANCRDNLETTRVSKFGTTAQESVIEILIALSICTSKGFLVTLLPSPFVSTVLGSPAAITTRYTVRKAKEERDHLRPVQGTDSNKMNRLRCAQMQTLSPLDVGIFVFASRTVGASQRGLYTAAILEPHTHQDREFASRAACAASERCDRCECPTKSLRGLACSLVCTSCASEHRAGSRFCSAAYCVGIAARPPCWCWNAGHPRPAFWRNGSVIAPPCSYATSPESGIAADGVGVCANYANNVRT